MIAALPMYDRPETAGANDRLWALVRDRLRADGVAAPTALRRGDLTLLDQWLDPSLVLSQTCGFPYRAKLHGYVTLVGTPDYGVAGCAPGYYRSVFVARADDPRDDLAAFDGAGLAYNDAMSQSGWAAPQTHAAKLGITLPALLETGGHRLSLHAVAEGRADIAALDAVTWSMLAEWEDMAARVKVVGMTDPTPGLPFITALERDGQALFTAISAAIDDLGAADRALLRIKGIISIPVADYLSVPTPPAPNRFAPEK
ncbi:MAG: PhnD/SsuA/transferrin family substrate-binding protein [Pseudomonadota bacterium]